MGIDVLLISIVIFVSSLVASLAGFGFSSVLMPLLLIFYPLTTVLPLAVIMRWLVDIWKMIVYRTKPNWGLILIIGLPAVGMSYLVSRVVADIPEGPLLRIFGIILLIYGITVIAGKAITMPQNNWIFSGVGGLLTGVIGGLFGTDGPFRTVVLSTFRLKKREFLFASGAIAFMIDSVRFVGYFQEGVRLSEDFYYGLMLFIPASILGVITGQLVVSHLSEEKFQLLIALFLIAVSLNFIIFA